MRRGRGNNVVALPSLTGPLPFGTLFAKMESRHGFKKHSQKVLATLVLNLVPRAPEVSQNGIFGALWGANGLSNGCRNGEKSDASKSVIFATLHTESMVSASRTPPKSIKNDFEKGFENRSPKNALISGSWALPEGERSRKGRPRGSPRGR